MKRKAYAKINLNLVILNKIEDGKHYLDSVFHKIDLCDDIEIEENDLDRCVISCNKKELENDNLILRAYEILKKRYKVKGLNVKLTKRIPMQAGLGGGSSNVATFIKMVNDYFNLNMTEKALNRIGKELGSDVIPCYYDEPVNVHATGYLVSKIISRMEFDLVVIKPNLECNTGLMYKKLDLIKNREIPDKNGFIVQALYYNDIDLLVNNLFNSFEEVVNCKEIKKDLIDSGSIGALLSGSGSSVFGIFRSREDAKRAYEKLSKKYECYLCKSINNHLKK